MRHTTCNFAAWLASALMAATVTAQQPNLDNLIQQQLPCLVTTYKSLHAAPELSHYEKNTSAFIASQLRALGYDVTEHVGKYPLDTRLGCPTAWWQ